MPRYELKAPTHAALEAAIKAAPANPEPYLVYADWLQAQGDPRGELIVVQAALVGADPGRAAELERRESAIIEDNEEAWLGAVAGNESTTDLRWRFGFLRSIHLAGESEGDFDVAQGLSHLLGSPVGRFIESVTIGRPGSEGAARSGRESECEYQPVVDVLVKKKPHTLRKLFIGDFAQDDDSEIVCSYLANAGKLWAALPGLQSVTIHVDTTTFGDIDLPELREFTVQTRHLDRPSCKALSMARWPKLERLSVWFGQEAIGGDCTIEDLAPTFDGTGLAAVKSLGLLDTQFTDEIVVALAGSKILKQLEKLDLSVGTMTAAGVKALLKHRKAFKHLKVLDISRNAIDNKALAGVSDICAEVKTDHQSLDAGRRRRVIRGRSGSR